MGMIKDRNSKEQREAEEIKKKWQGYRELYKKGPQTQMIMMVITHFEPDILECEVKWALGGIILYKVSRDNRIPAELFQILTDDAVKMIYSLCQEIWKTQ